MTDKDKEMVDKMVEHIKEFVYLSSCMKDEILISTQSHLMAEFVGCHNSLHTRADVLFFETARDLLTHYRNEIRRYREKEDL
jgi:hypothetical protein